MLFRNALFPSLPWLRRALVAGGLLFLAAAAGPAAAQPVPDVQLDPASIDRAASRVAEALREAVRHGGGDPDRQHIHLVFGFSTGHFSSDPASAEAARAVASALVRQFLVPGDRVSAYAWEMDLWDHLHGGAMAGRPGESEGVTVPREKERLFALWPLTPRAGSAGGHDTERALVRIADRLGNAQDAVILLLTNDAASVSAVGERVIGADAPEYRRLFERWWRVPAVDHSGASLVAPFELVRRNGSRQRNRIHAVILAPQQFSGQPLAAPRPRWGSGDRARAGASGTMLLALLLIAAAVAGLGLLLKSGLPALGALAGGRRWRLKIADSSFLLSEYREGQLICEIVGAACPADGSDTQWVRVPQAPPERLARVLRKGDGVEIRGDGGSLKLVKRDGDAIDGVCHLAGEGQHHLEFAGEVRSAAHLPPQIRQVSVRVELQRQRPQE